MMRAVFLRRLNDAKAASSVLFLRDRFARDIARGAIGMGLVGR